MALSRLHAERWLEKLARLNDRVTAKQNSSTILLNRDYSGDVRRHRLNKGGFLFKRTRYQHGSVEREERKKGPEVWVYRWWEEDINGKLVHRKQQIGDVETYPTESAAHAAADALRLTINNRCKHRSLQRTTINTLWEHYSREELPRQGTCPRKTPTSCTRRIGLCRAGANMQLDQVKTVEVERWLRATEVADGTKAKIKCVMSALFSHAVRWEFCGHNPISSGIPVGSGGRTGPSTGVRVSAKRQKSPLILTADRWRRFLTELEFRDQLLVFLDAGLGIRRGRTGSTPLDGLRFRQPSLRHPTFLLLASRRASE